MSKKINYFREAIGILRKSGFCTKDENFHKGGHEQVSMILWDFVSTYLPNENKMKRPETGFRKSTYRRKTKYLVILARKIYQNGQWKNDSDHIDLNLEITILKYVIIDDKRSEHLFATIDRKFKNKETKLIYDAIYEIKNRKDDVTLSSINIELDKKSQLTSETRCVIQTLKEALPEKSPSEKIQTSNIYKSKEDAEKFYKSYEWRKMRMVILKNYGRRCACCGAVPQADNNVIANIDHIKPLRKYWHLKLDPSNLQVLCNECNHGKGSWDETAWNEVKTTNMKLIRNGEVIS